MSQDADFTFYGLTGNPFLKELQNLPMVNREENKRELQGIIGEFLGSDSPGIMVIWGNYGMGKSFTLKKLVLLLEKPDWTAGKTVLPVFLKSIEPEEKGRFLPNLFTKIMTFIGPKGMKNLVRSADKALLKNNTLFRLMVRAVEGDDVARDWLVGRRMTSGELRKLSVRFTPSEYSEIRGLLFEFLEVLRAANYSSLILLIDEWEFLMSVVSRQRLWAIVREIQRLYDTFGEESDQWRSVHSTLITILASSAGAWYRFLDIAKEVAAKQGGATTETFLRRIAEKAKVELSPLGKDHIKELIISRMEPQRKDPRDREKIAPFSEDYVDLMEKITHGIPSRVLRYSALILSEGAQKKIPTIDSEFAGKVLKDYGLWEELVPARAGTG